MLLVKRVPCLSVVKGTWLQDDPSRLTAVHERVLGPGVAWNVCPVLFQQCQQCSILKENI